MHLENFNCFPRSFKGQNLNEFETDSDCATYGAKFGSSISEKAIGKAFIRKVFSVLMVQLAITVGVICLFLHSFMTFMWMIAMTYCKYVGRTFPLNFICLFLYTFAESFRIGVHAGAYEAEEVMWAAGICAFIFSGLTASALQTKYDFTLRGGFLFVALLYFVIFGIFAIFLHDKIIQLAYACVFPLLFSMYLGFDTQLLIGGHHKYLISPEEYIFEKYWLSPATYIFIALKLYLDINY
ncbi:protein lifeguard 1 isoform X2 [Parasteatoda tepidariorum]|uniref:protein lifeguard 1 isoform X2 n=1 Tax=Parasteatoda tepidariorum TaxID=114398 RepID=UPI001C720C37|nr:protein lifeguard 2 isoform X2 [Parasteatoda tepidariorum]XP_042897380.1 protein lifeguard 2 isoform X2 [Parasteatoda tepidariorum]